MPPPVGRAVDSTIAQGMTMDIDEASAADRPMATLVTGVIGSDPHSVGNIILAYALRNAGFKVVGLGTMVPPEEFIKAAVEAAADAILISSLSGYGEVDARGFRQKCQEAGIGEILLYIGGNIVMGRIDHSEVERIFRDMGFDRAYPPGVHPDQVIRDLTADFASRGVLRQG